MKLSRLIITLICAALAASTPTANAAPGDLDLTFGGTGKVITDFGGTGNDNGNSVAIQSDGKIVVAGTSGEGNTSRFALVRYNIDGSPDTSFGGTGKVTTTVGSGSGGNSVALQSDGKIVVAGSAADGSSADFAVVRYNSDGSLDTSFNGTGMATTDLFLNGFDIGFSVALQSDEKIVVAGYTNRTGPYDFAMVRYNSNGSLDMSFNGTGKVIKDFGSNYDQGRSVAVQSDGKIVVAGDFGLARFDSNGGLDSTFNSTGVSPGVNSPGYGLRALALQNDGKIVVTGINYVFRYNADGSIRLDL